MVSRSAEYSIQGFIYEFVKCLNSILHSKNNENITVNGIIEDIDISTPVGTKAIQCKYHESKTKFNLSDIYKPLLLMMDQYSINPLNNVEYVLFAHFPSEPVGLKILTVSDIESILKTNDKKLSKIADVITQRAIDINAFLSKFTFEIGDSLKELQVAAIKGLESEGFSKEDIIDIFYPNSIHLISELAIEKKPSSRKITKDRLLEKLAETKKTAISRWTLELKTYTQILKARRLQLSSNLKHHSRLRYFVINQYSISDFDVNVVNFIEEFVRKYNNNVKIQDQTPVFCFVCNQHELFGLMKRIHKKGLNLESGLIGDYFDPVHFIREPERKVSKSWVEFQGRICQFDDETVKIFNSTKPDDLYVIGDIDLNKIDTQDLNVEILNVNTLNELKYLLWLSQNINL